MGILSSIGARFAIPLVIIAIAGILVVTFRTQLVGGASALGRTAGSVVTAPFTSFIDTVGQAFGNLQDFSVRIPGANLEFGDLSITGRDPFSQLFDFFSGNGGNGGTPEIPDVPIGDPRRTPFRDAERFEEDFPDEPIPPPEPTPELFGGRFAESFNVSGAGRLSFEELQATQPGAVVGLFDILGTQTTEFLPFNVQQVQASLEAGQRLRLSGQVFEDIRGIRNVEDLFA